MDVSNNIRYHLFDSIAGYIASRKYSQCFTCCTFNHVTAFLKMVELNSSKFYTQHPVLTKWTKTRPCHGLGEWLCVFPCSTFGQTHQLTCRWSGLSSSCFSGQCFQPFFANSSSSDSSYSPFAVPFAYLDTGLTGDSVRWLCFWLTPLTCLPSCRHNPRLLYISGWTTGSPAAIQYAHVA